MAQEQSTSHLFTLRVWYEGQINGQDQWRCKLHHIPSDTNFYFRGWDAVIPAIQQLLLPPDVLPCRNNEENTL